LDSLPLALKAIRIHDSWMNFTTERDLAVDAHYPPEVRFTRTAAICHLACTMEGVFVPLAKLVRVAKTLSMGLRCDEVSQQDVANEAWTLVSTLNSAPSVACWISIFNGRFDMATHAKFAGQLQNLDVILVRLLANL